MTAIAYRDGILAVDGQTSWGNIKTKSRRKVEAVNIAGMGHCLVVLSGTVHGCESLVNHLTMSRYSSGKLFEGMEASSRYGIAIDSKMKVYPVFGDGYVGRADFNEFIAEGSAFEFLMGAMSAGASAKEAVELACKYCNYCGGDVYTVDVGEWFGRSYNG